MTQVEENDLVKLTGLSADPAPYQQKPQVAAYPHERSQHPANYIIFRSLVNPKEAGAIIGKGGATVASVREETKVRAGVSKSEDGHTDRILTISGEAEQVARAYGIFAKHLCDTLHETPSPTARLRILTPHSLMGAIIGKGGSKIKNIQADSGSRMSISKEMLPQSTERTIDIVGTPESIEMALLLLGNIALEEADKIHGTIYYNPGVHPMSKFGGPQAGYPPRGRKEGGEEEMEELTQTLTIPSNMVGCIIGRAGSFIGQIRRLSGARLRIEDAEANSDERKVHIVGTEHSINEALGLLYTQLETEKARRLANAAAAAAAHAPEGGAPMME